MKRLSIALCGALMLAAGPALSDQMLAMQSGCMGCHKADAKLVGPSFQDIAAKYKGQDVVDELAAKVKAGSKPGEGVWGDAAMPPSPASEENIAKVVRWIIDAH